MNRTDWLTAPGGALKALGEGRVGGYLVVYSDAASPDLEGDYFTPETAFDLDDSRTVGVYYQHGQDAALGKRRIGVGRLRRDPLGIWIDAQLDLRDHYERAVYRLAQDGRLGWSSGVPAHLVERRPDGKAQHITRWLIAEASLTPVPAEPRARAVAAKHVSFTAQETHSMGEGETLTEHAGNGDALAALQAQVAEMSAQVGQALRLLEDQPAVRGAGYFTVDGGAADRHIKSFGDWMLAVMRGDDLRLRTVYKSHKTLSTETGSAGGYTVPVEYGAQLLQAAAEASPVLARVRRIPVSAPMGEYPALDQYLAPAPGSGQTALAGGVKPAKRAEGGAYGETEPAFTTLRYRITDAASGMVKVTKELRADSAAGIEAFLRNVISVSVASKLEYYILRGSGAGEPLGILNAPAKIDITPDTNNSFAYADAVEMVSRFKAVAGAPVWLYHPGLINDIAHFSTGSGGTSFAASLNAPLQMALLGYPLISSEHLPQPDSSGCALLADLGAYVLFEKGGLYIEFSEHAAFAEGKDTWRFGVRCDGQPWMKSAITLADPQGSYTVSPFVSFND